MLLLSTRFNVDGSLKRRPFVDLVAAQLGSAPDSTLTLAGCGWEEREDTVVQNEAETERVVINNYEEALVLQYVSRPISVTGDTYITTCVLRDRDEVPSMYMSIEKESKVLSLADRNKDDQVVVPTLLRAIFWNEYGGMDGWLETDLRPRYVRKGDVGRLSEVLYGKEQGKGTFLNPIVYVSVCGDGEYLLDCDALAKDLAGQAHVLVESSPVIASQMALSVDDMSKAPHDGGVCVFLPNGDRVLVDRADTPAAYAADVRELISDLLLGLAVEDRYSASRLRHESVIAKLGGDSELSKLCDELLRDKEHSIERLEAENRALKAELARSRYKAESLKNGLEKSEQMEGGKFITLAVTEGELYEGELKDVILRSLGQVHDGMSEAETLNRCRKFHVLSDVLEHNFPRDTDTRLCECVRGAFEDGTLTREGIGRLRAAGFVVDRDGKGHYKIRFGDDERYTGTFGCTPSDSQRSSKNFVSEFCNLLFGY